jgi:hypothetical protein
MGMVSVRHVFISLVAALVPAYFYVTQEVERSNKIIRGKITEVSENQYYVVKDDKTPRVVVVPISTARSYVLLEEGTPVIVTGTPPRIRLDAHRLDVTRSVVGLNHTVSTVSRIPDRKLFQSEHRVGWQDDRYGTGVRLWTSNDILDRLEIGVTYDVYFTDGRVIDIRPRR